jgi:hypothetical protein
MGFSALHRLRRSGILPRHRYAPVNFVISLSPAPVPDSDPGWERVRVRGHIIFLSLRGSEGAAAISSLHCHFEAKQRNLSLFFLSVILSLTQDLIFLSFPIAFTGNPIFPLPLEGRF